MFAICAMVSIAAGRRNVRRKPARPGGGDPEEVERRRVPRPGGRIPEGGEAGFLSAAAEREMTLVGFRHSSTRQGGDVAVLEALKRTAFPCRHDRATTST